MNPFDLTASELLIWGIVAHLVADWPLQNDWMANGKAWPWRWSVTGLAPAFTHGLVHMVLLGLVFGYWPGVALGLVHIAVDTRLPVVWWSRLMRQTQPKAPAWVKSVGLDFGERDIIVRSGGRGAPLMDVGMEVRFWTDQVFHIATVAVAALAVAHAF